MRAALAALEPLSYAAQNRTGTHAAPATHSTRRSRGAGVPSASSWGRRRDHTERARRVPCAKRRARIALPHDGGSRPRPLVDDGHRRPVQRLQSTLARLHRSKPRARGRAAAGRAACTPRIFQRCMTTFLDAFVARKSFSMEYRLRRHDGRIPLGLRPRRTALRAERLLRGLHRLVHRHHRAAPGTRRARTPQRRARGSRARAHRDRSRARGALARGAPPRHKRSAADFQPPQHAGAAPRRPRFGARAHRMSEPRADDRPDPRVHVSIRKSRAAAALAQHPWPRREPVARRWTQRPSR